MQADLSLRYIFIRYGMCSCKANKLNNRQCLFFSFRALWLRYRLASFINVQLFFLYLVRHNI